MSSPTTRPSAALVARWVWQPDKWERLTTVAALARPALRTGDRVADVGGRGHELRGLLAGCEVTSINVEPPCDVLVEPGRLPFDDDAFDVVLSTDVLEHVPADQRREHVAELVRVASRRVVLCFPCGSETKDASEQRLAATLQERYGTRFDFLDEHLACGLPRAADVADLVHAADPAATTRVLFQDGVLEAERLLLDAVRAVKGREPGAFWRSARAWTVRHRPTLTHVESPDNNRAYVVVDLPGARLSAEPCGPAPR